MIMWDWIKNFFGKFWKKLLDWLWWLLDSFFTPLKWAIEGFFIVFEWLVYTLFDGLLLAVLAIFKTFDLSAAFFTHSAGWLGLPDQLVWLITQLGLPQCFSIMGAALGFRLLLNLIPASLTRV